MRLNRLPKDCDSRFLFLRVSLILDGVRTVCMLISGLIILLWVCVPSAAQQRATGTPPPLSLKPPAISSSTDAAPESYQLGVNDSISVKCINLAEFGDA